MKVFNAYCIHNKYYNSTLNIYVFCKILCEEYEKNRFELTHVSLCKSKKKKKKKTNITRVLVHDNTTKKKKTTQKTLGDNDN